MATIHADRREEDFCQFMTIFSMKDVVRELVRPDGGGWSERKIRWRSEETEV
jgi:hypothetical protein